MLSFHIYNINRLNILANNVSHWGIDLFYQIMVYCCFVKFCRNVDCAGDIFITHSRDLLSVWPLLDSIFIGLSMDEVGVDMDIHTSCSLGDEEYVDQLIIKYVCIGTYIVGAV